MRGEKFVNHHEYLADRERRAEVDGADGSAQVVCVAYGLIVALDALLAQRAHEIAHADVHVSVVLDVNPPIDRPYRLALDDFRGTIAEIHVSLQASEVQHEIRLVHPRDDRRRAYWPDVDAHVQRMIHRERALA